MEIVYFFTNFLYFALVNHPIFFIFTILLSIIGWLVGWLLFFYSLSAELTTKKNKMRCGNLLGLW